MSDETIGPPKTVVAGSTDPSLRRLAMRFVRKLRPDPATDAQQLIRWFAARSIPRTCLN